MGYTVSDTGRANTPQSKGDRDHGNKREAENQGGAAAGGGPGDGKGGIPCPGAGALCRMRHPLFAGGPAGGSGDLRGVRPLWTGTGGSLRLRAGRLLRPAGSLLRLPDHGGLCGGPAVRGGLCAGLFGGLRLL